VTHYALLVLVPPSKIDTEQVVEKAMRKARRHLHHDWYMIGGRYTGWLDSKYDPEKDPKNIATCDLCGGTGRRPDAESFGKAWIEWSKGCNGCLGKGRKLKWPTDWRKFPGDIIPAAKIKAKAFWNKFGGILTPDGKYIERTRDEQWQADWDAAVKKYWLSNAVVVDYHQ
jgi:hypothetical protein